MSDSSPSIAKWPFLLGDFCVLAAAAVLAWMAHSGELPWSLGLGAVLAAAVAIGAWILVTPFLREHEGRLKLLEQDGLANTLAQIRQLGGVADSVVASGNQMAASQQSLRLANEAARSLMDEMHAERRAFMEFIQKRDDQERQTLRLEVDKLRRGEEESFKVICHLLDHNYAVFLAGLRSGQPELAQQLGNFRATCLDAVRRVGIVSHEAQPGEPFNPEFHQTADGEPPAPDARVAGTIACGYTIRGLPVRPIIVQVEVPAMTADAGGPEDSGPASAS